MSTCVKHWENSNVLFSQLSTRQSLLGRKTTLKIQVKYKVDKVIKDWESWITLLVFLYLFKNLKF